MSDCAEGYLALTDAEPGYKEAHAYHEGTVAEVFASRNIARLLRKTGDRFKMNVIRSVVNSVSDRLDILGCTVVTTTGGGGEGAPASSAQARLDRILKANAFEFEAPNVMRRASEYGDAFLLVWDGPTDDEGSPLGEPLMNYHSPLSMRVVYDADNPRLKRYAVQVWQVPGLTKETVAYRMNLYYADRVERWASKPGMKPTDPEGWEPHLPVPDDPDSWVSENPHGEVPVFHFRNGAPYGMPEHYHGYGAQDAINKIVIAHMSTIDFHIAPQRYALLDGGEGDPDDFDLGDDDGFDVDPDDTVEREARKGIKSGAAELWWMKGVRSVGQFEPSDSKNFIDPASFYLRMMAQTTETPLHMVDESNDEPSGESRRRKEGPLTKKVKDRQRMYGATFAEALSFALKVAGLPDREVKVTFAPAEVVADGEGWNTIKSKIEAGVPVRTALMEAGYPDTEVEKWFPEGEENTFRVSDLVAVADVLQKVGAAVAMGIISAEEGRALLPEGVLPEGAAAPPAPQIVGEPGPEIILPD